MTSVPETDMPPFGPPYPVTQARFAPGDIVRVRRGRGPGHIRTPSYLRGRIGRIERICGSFANPEELAFHRHGLPTTALYRVRFAMDEIWGALAERPTDTVDAEIFEHWLEPASAD